MPMPLTFYLAIIPTYRLGGAGCDAETNEVMFEPRFSREIVNLTSRQRRKDWLSVQRRACVCTSAASQKALSGGPLAAAVEPIRGSRQ